jgi:Cft2 family RNA processing exonuclease
VQNLRQTDALPPKSIVLATSGFMKEGTYSMQIAKKILNDPTCGIGFVGYLEPDSPGYQLREKSLRALENETRILNGAEIQTFHFSAHANQMELLQLVEKTNPKLVILFHGDPDARNTMQNLIQSNFSGIQVLDPKEGQTINLSSYLV